MCSKYYYLSNLGISGRACPWKAPCFPAWLHPRYPLLRRYSLREKERLSSLVSPSIHLSVSTTVTLTGKAWPQIYSPPSSTRGFPGGWLSTKEPMRETWVLSQGQEDPPKKETATHSSMLAWEIPWTEEPTIQGVTKELDMT